MIDWAQHLIIAPILLPLATGALLLFIGFYPLLSGLPIPRSYAQYLRWFNWLNF